MTSLIENPQNGCCCANVKAVYVDLQGSAGLKGGEGLPGVAGPIVSLSLFTFHTIPCVFYNMLSDI